MKWHYHQRAVVPQVLHYSPSHHKWQILLQKPLSQVSFGTGDPSTHDIYIGWNEFSNPVASDTHGGVIFVSKSSEAAVASYPTRDIHIHDNYFHDGNEDFVYIGDGV